MRDTFLFRTPAFLLAAAVLAQVTLGLRSSVSDAAEPDVDQPLRPAHAAQTMVVPDGFNVTLFAGEPDVKQPIGFSIDDRGRLWVAEAYNYPSHGTKAGDRIVILEDSDGDGRHDKRTVFYDQLNYVTGIEVGFGGAWVMSPPSLYFIPDRNGDDRPDGDPEVLLDGFGNHANAHNLANGFAWGPDGWLYGTHGRTNWSMIGKPGTPKEDRVRFDGGVYRYHPVRHVWEPYADGTTNPWGIDWDDYGQSFVCNCVTPHLFHVIPGAHYEPSRNRKSSEFAYDRIPTIADHLHYTGTGNVRDGAGTAAEDAAGGGHAHCGTMVYLGDNWPDRYRNTLFTNNIHGRRINNDILKRAGSGYTASHGPDIMRSRDPWFMGVTLQYGPDGSVFVIDWSDTGECHSVRNTQRHTGRIYRIAYGTPQRPELNLAGSTTSSELVVLQTHRNDWFVRHARRLLQERSSAGADMTQVHAELRAMFAAESSVPKKLRALWASHSTGGLDEPTLLKLLDHESEHVRTWAIQLLVESRVSGTRQSPFVTRDLSQSGNIAPATLNRFRELAAIDPSPQVRLYLASALQRLSHDERWPIAEALALHEEDDSDANIPLMLWYGVEPLIHDDSARFAKLAQTSRMSVVRRHVARRVAALTPSEAGLERMAAVLAGSDDATGQRDVIDGILRGLEGRRRVDMPAGWNAAYARLESSPRKEVRQRAVRLALIFDDHDALRRLKAVVTDHSAKPSDRTLAIDALVARNISDVAPILLKLIEDDAVLPSVLRGLAEYDHPATVQTILDRYDRMPAAARQVAIQTLASRRTWAGHLLTAIESEKIGRAEVPAFTARQIRNLGDDRLTSRLNAVWGEVRATPKDRARRIASFKQRLTAEEISHGNLSDGRLVYQKLCGNCHRLFDAGRQVGPDITGAQRNNLDYLLENLLDPSAQVARDFQMEVIQTESGRVITGLVKSETEAAVTVATVDGNVVVPVNEIGVRKKSGVSMMPEGQLKHLTFTQTRDLIAYLGTSRQVPLPGEQPESANHADWISLFNGRDLTGWRANVKPESYSVVDGELKVHGRNGMSHLFYTGDNEKDDTFVNFEFEAEIRAEPNSNSGIFFHTDRELRNRKYLNKGYEVQLNSTAKEKRKTGSLYAVVDLDKSPVDETKWFKLRFRVHGKRIEVWLNGKQVMDYVEPANPEHPASRAKRLIDAKGGAIAIQAHDPGSVFYFRSIRVRRLNSPLKK
jgi:putative membrane-bound dehydrogenase-like protein